MTPSRTRAILELLSEGRDEKLATAVTRVFGASSIQECLETYDAVGKAERAQLDEVVKRVTEDASAAFSLRVDGRVS
ncbi:MAG TPA: hypothetical protein VKB93_06485 [Thermoanaerobaculia bacterium]|nr:hypothetical protein [Thermoanaerobaculia bacterium]